MKRVGICTLGNLIVDLQYQAASYPKRGELAKIQGTRGRAVGGLACNTALSLSMLDPSLPIMVQGVLGEDAEGRYIRSVFAAHKNIDTTYILQGEETAYTLVINDAQSKERTFFTSMGSGDLLRADSVDVSTLPCRILHAGYILLMPGLDARDAEYGTQMARLLHKAQMTGIRTSIDVVSQTGGEYTTLVPPALKYADYCIINELEAQQITGIELRDNGQNLLSSNMQDALTALANMGVAHWAVIHSPEGAWGLDEAGQFVSLPSLKLPEGWIMGTTGAGDAFASGVLYGAHEGWPLIDALRLGTASAACSLNAADSYSAIRPVVDALTLYKELGGQ